MVQFSEHYWVLTLLAALCFLAILVVRADTAQKDRIAKAIWPFCCVGSITLLVLLLVPIKGNEGDRLTEAFVCLISILIAFRLLAFIPKKSWHPQPVMKTSKA